MLNASVYDFNLLITLSYILQICILRLLKQKYADFLLMKQLLLDRIENSVAKEEISRYVLFLLLPECFQTMAPCRCVRMCLQEGKGWEIIITLIHYGAGR